MERLTKNLHTSLCVSIISIFASSAFAYSNLTNQDNHHLLLQKQPGFFRANFDSVKMPNNIQNMGLLGVSYLAELNPYFYTGIGTYGSITGTQGGLFVLGAEGGLHYQFAQNWWADAGMFIGGGGGRSSLVGGGLMLRPHAGIEYDFDYARVGLHYSYISFPSGKIRSKQFGIDFDIPFDFYYVHPCDYRCGILNYFDIKLPCGEFLDFDKNDVGILLQAYYQDKNTKNVAGQIQNGTVGLVGAELDHYFTRNAFWYLKGAGALHGIPNGYMDILGGLGYHWSWSCSPNAIALVPQLGIGAGGGGNVDTGGGVLVQPQLGVEIPITSNFAARVSGGYLWSPKGQMRSYTLTGTLLYHLNIATGSCSPPCVLARCFNIQGWRVHWFNQTYVQPQRTSFSYRTPINLFALQIDQMFSPYIFLSYQGSFAYSGQHAGGYATGMIGPGIQSDEFCNQRIRAFAEILGGAGGGGNLAMGGGALIEPVVGLHFAINPCMGLQASVGQVKAVNHNLNTPVVNVGVTFSFGTLNSGYLG